MNYREIKNAVSVMLHSRIPFTPLNLVKTCNAFYECPKDSSGKRLGPLVGYAGRDEAGRQFVGDIYINFAQVERYGEALQYVAKRLGVAIKDAGLLTQFDSFCGAPEGGKALATALSIANDAEYIFPEKKVTALATAASREQTKLVFGRHEPYVGERVMIVEDVCNNFSTTAELVKLIEGYEACCVGIVCFLNRSDKVQGTFTIPHILRDNPTRIPIVSLVSKAFPQYRQDDPAVAADIAAGNIIWKPKDEWDKVEAAMNRS